MSRCRAWSPWAKLNRSSCTIKMTLETTTMMQLTPVASKSKSTSQSRYTKERKSSSITTGCAWSSTGTCLRRQHRLLEPPITQSTSNLALLRGILLKTRNLRQKRPSLILNRQQGLASGSRACVYLSEASQTPNLKTRSGSSTKAAWGKSKMAKKWSIRMSAMFQKSRTYLLHLLVADLERESRRSNKLSSSSSLQVSFQRTWLWPISSTRRLNQKRRQNRKAWTVPKWSMPSKSK